MQSGIPPLSLFAVLLSAFLAFGIKAFRRLSFSFAAFDFYLPTFFLFRFLLFRFCPVTLFILVPRTTLNSTTASSFCKRGHGDLALHPEHSNLSMACQSSSLRSCLVCQPLLLPCRLKSSPFQTFIPCLVPKRFHLWSLSGQHLDLFRHCIISVFRFATACCCQAFNPCLPAKPYFLDRQQSETPLA